MGSLRAPVALRQIHVIVVTHDLQQHEAPEQHECEAGDAEGSHDAALHEEPLLVLVILDACVAGHGQRGECRRPRKPVMTGQTAAPVAMCTQRVQLPVWCRVKPSMAHSAAS